MTCRLDSPSFKKKKKKRFANRTQVALPPFVIKLKPRGGKLEA